MDRLDSALKGIKKKKEMKEGALAVVGKAAMAVAKGAGKVAKAGSKVAKAGSKVAKSGSKVVNPKVMGGEVKKSAQIAKNVKPKSGPTIDVKATEVGGEIAKKKKETMAAKSSTPKTKYPKNKQQDDLSGGGSLAKTDKKKPEVEKPKEDKPKEDKPKKKVPKANKKGKNKIKQGIEAIDKAYGTTSFSVKEQKTFKEWLEKLPVEQLDEYAMAIPAIAKGFAVAKVAAPYVMSAIGAGGIIKNMMSKKYDPSDKVNRPKVTPKPNPKDGESWTDGIGGRPTRNLSGRYKTHKQGQEKINDFNKDLTPSSPGAEFKPDNSGEPGDNPEARAKIRDMLNKLKKKKK